MIEASKQLRVFVVDDEEIISSTLATILRLHGGLHATSFTDPLKALEFSQSETPDLLITDIMMPELSGIELAIQMKRQCPDCKVLLFSGHTASSPAIKVAREKGYAFELLSKPVHPADLLAKIRNLAETAEAPSEPNSGSEK
jgi:DNA-binding NtrC family response regulator